jgi:hypothetical protein
MRYGGGFRFVAALFVMGVVAFFATGAFFTGFVVGAASNGAAASNWDSHGIGSVIGVLLTILIFLVVLRIIGFALFGGHHRAWAHHGYWRGDFDAERCGPGGPGGPGMGYMGHRGFGHGHHGRHGMGPGGWQKSEWRDAGQTWFDEFHRRSHGTDDPATGGTAAGGTGEAPTTGEQPK